MFGQLERRTWQSDPTLIAPARFRRACAYDTFIPRRLIDLELSVPGDIAGLISAAESEIRALNDVSIPTLDPFARLLLRTESIASSKVEGMHVDARSLARAEVELDTGRRVSRTVAEVIGNIDAMQLAIEDAIAEPRLTIDDIVRVHRALMQKSDRPGIAGQVRTEQNWIGGNDYNPCGAQFVPPPPELVPGLLRDLVEFCNDDALSPLVQAAIAHAQYETIHPHVDGNGRTGRALIQIILRRRGLAPHYVPPISVVLAANKERYIEGLEEYRSEGFSRWLEIFSTSAARSAQLASTYLREVANLQDRWRTRLERHGRVRRDAAAWQLIDALPSTPILTVAVGVARIHRSKPAVNAAVDQLVEAGVLAPISQSSRNRAWEAVGLLDLLSQLEANELPT